MDSKVMNIFRWLSLCMLFGCINGAGATAVDNFFGEIESVVYIIDLSSTSQQGGEQSLEMLKPIVLASISRLDPDCSFDIMSNVVERYACFGSLKEASQSNVSEASEWIGELSQMDLSDIFLAIAAESGVPPYDECMTFVLFISGTQNSTAWRASMPSTSPISWLPDGASLIVVLVPPVDVDFQTLCETLTNRTGGRLIITD